VAAQLAIDWEAPRRNRTAAREALTPEGLRDDHLRILEALRVHGPKTDDSIRFLTGIHPNAIRARRGELVTRGQVVPVGSTIGSSGRKVTLWGLK
jgi:hypothetical protein